MTREERGEEERSAEDGDAERRQSSGSHPENGERAEPEKLAQNDQKVHDVAQFQFCLQI